MLVAGIDIGSSSSKAVIMEDNKILDWGIISTRPDTVAPAQTVMDLVLKKTGLSIADIGYIVSTGYGRVNVPFAQKKVNEI
jgi:activator of 2-hydroxyglutaryl-CoA dehydratase